MNNINIHNYEAYFLDFIEGTLSKEQLDELDLFLDKHPEYKEDLAMMSNDVEPILVSDDIIFENKNVLKKISLQEKPEEWYIADIEGELNNTEKELLYGFLTENNAELNQYELYKKTILKPDLDIVFKHKNKLKHHKLNVKKILYLSLSSAASIILIAYFLFLYKQEDLNSIKSNFEIAQLKKTPVKTLNLDFNYLLKDIPKQKLANYGSIIKPVKRIELEIANLYISNLPNLVDVSEEVKFQYYISKRNTIRRKVDFTSYFAEVNKNSDRERTNIIKKKNFFTKFKDASVNLAQKIFGKLIKVERKKQKVKKELAVIN